MVVSLVKKEFNSNLQTHDRRNDRNFLAQKKSRLSDQL